MPMYDYKCLDCKKKFTLTLSVAQHDKMHMKCPKCGFIFKDPARVKGGKTSRRVLTPEQARAMVRARERKKRRLKGGGRR